MRILNLSARALADRAREKPASPAVEAIDAHGLDHAFGRDAIGQGQKFATEEHEKARKYI
jgi:hypothetical protein